jgi:protein TonB
VAQLTEGHALPLHTEVSTPAHTKSSKTVPTTPSNEATNVYDCGEIMPRYPGGDKALLEFINSNLRYPDLALEYGAKGRVIIGFLVDTVGAVSDFKVIRCLLSCDTLRLHQESTEHQKEISRLINEQMQEEALRVVSLLRQQPRWNPGEEFGRRKNVKFYVPVRFLPTEQIIR